MTLHRFLLTTGFTIICLIIGARPTWAHHGGLDTPRSDELKAVLASLVQPAHR